MNLEKSIPLRKSINLGDLTYEKLDLREPTAGELERASEARTSIGVTINLISEVAKVPRPVAERLCQRDLKEASDFLNSFDDDSQATG